VKQVVPASITGIAGAPAASVLDHRFGDSDPFTLGVEEEYMLLDPESFDLVQHIDTVLDAVGRAHRAGFANARPATTGIVTELLDPRWLVEIEAEAVIA